MLKFVIKSGNAVVMCTAWRRCSRLASNRLALPVVLRRAEEHTYAHNATSNASSTKNDLVRSLSLYCFCTLVVKELRFEEVLVSKHTLRWHSSQTHGLARTRNVDGCSRLQRADALL